MTSLGSEDSRSVADRPSPLDASLRASPSPSVPLDATPTPTARGRTVSDAPTHMAAPAIARAASAPPSPAIRVSVTDGAAVDSPLMSPRRTHSSASPRASAHASDDEVLGPAPDGSRERVGDERAGEDAAGDERRAAEPPRLGGTGSQSKLSLYSHQSSIIDADDLTADPSVGEVVAEDLDETNCSDLVAFDEPSLGPERHLYFGAQL